MFSSSIWLMLSILNFLTSFFAIPSSCCRVVIPRDQRGGPSA
jgi:hypothetical protein